MKVLGQKLQKEAEKNPDRNLGTSELSASFWAANHSLVRAMDIPLVVFVWAGYLLEEEFRREFYSTGSCKDGKGPAFADFMLGGNSVLSCCHAGCDEPTVPDKWQWWEPSASPTAALWILSLGLFFVWSRDHADPALVDVPGPGYFQRACQFASSTVQLSRARLQMLLLFEQSPWPDNRRDFAMWPIVGAQNVGQVVFSIRG